MNFELSNNQSQMEVVPRIPGHSLCRIPPKLSLQQIEIDVNYDLVSDNNSQRDLPKFATISQKANSIKPQQNLSHPLRHIMLNRNMADVMNFEEKSPKSSLVVLAEIIVWACYFIATAQTRYSGLNALQVANIIGNAISFIHCVNRILLRQEKVQLSDILHAASWLTTLTLYFYSPQNSDDSFVNALMVIRSFRLFFPLNYQYTFKDLLSKCLAIVKRILKHTFRLIIAIIVLGLMMQQSAGRSIYDRCRPTISPNSSMSAADAWLCGSRTCPQNYSCLNPYSFDELPNEEQLITNAFLSFGVFRFDSLLRSTFTILQLGTLSQSSAVIAMFSNVFQVEFWSIFALIVLIVVQLHLFLIMLIIVAEIGKSRGLKPCEQTKTVETTDARARNTQNSMQGYSNALTFGLITNRQPSSLKKSTHSLQIHKYFVIDCFFLRSIRIMLLLNQNEPIRKGYVMLTNMAMAFKQLWLVMLLLLLFNYACCVTAAIENTPPSDKGQTFLHSISQAVLMLQKGFDLYAVDQQNGSVWGMYSVWSMQSAIYYIMVTIPLNACCIALMLKQILWHSHAEQMKQVGRIVEQSRAAITVKEACQLYQKQQIRDSILSMRPAINPVYHREASLLVRLCSSSYFRYGRLGVCGVSSVMLVIVGLVSEQAGESSIFRLKMVRVCLFTLQLLLFMVEAVAYRCDCPSFVTRLSIYMVSIPGHFIMLVPFYKIYASQPLKAVLTVFVSLPPLTLLNFYLQLNNTAATSLCSWLEKMQQSVHFLLWYLLLGWLFAAILALCLQDIHFTTLFVYVMIGLLGGNYSSALDITQLPAQKRVVVSLVNTGVCLCSLILRNGLITVALCQLSHTLKEKAEQYLFAKDNLISRKHFNSLFSLDKYRQIWSVLDPAGSGVLNYSVVLHNIHHFLRPFTNHQLYIQFVLQDKQMAYHMKLQLFRRLNLPIRTANKQYHQDIQTGYVITFYDLAARLACLAMEQEDINKAHSNQCCVQVNSIQPTDWAFVLQVDGDEWNEQVSRCISKLNGARVEMDQECVRYSLQKRVDLESASLASVIGVLPQLRRKMQLAKLKLQ